MPHQKRLVAVVPAVVNGGDMVQEPSVDAIGLALDDHYDVARAEP